MTDHLDGVLGTAAPLLKRVDEVLAATGAPADHELWPAVRRVRLLPWDAVQTVAGLRPQALAAAAPELRADARSYAGIAEALPTPDDWTGDAADAYDTARRRTAQHLSGGLDSSLVCAIAARKLKKPLRTFSIGMDVDAIDLKYARKVAEFIGSDHTEVIITKEDVLAALFYIARSDGPITRGELPVLQGIHLRFGLDNAAWERAKGVQGSSYGGAGSRVEQQQRTDDAYAVLGLTPAATDEQVRQAWRKLMRENHPDGLAARGVPAEFVERATRKVAEINAAWDRIKRERGL